ncbi:MAG: hypothetical protein JWR44_645 [Hymenobacter sp.]|jgi:ferric enterobactin receptor|nr:hypothetical protein [Hymenobacter sp.]
MPYSATARRCLAPLQFLRTLLALALVVPAAALGQGRAGVSGTVATPAGVAVEYATVTLHRAADSAVVKTEFTDMQGHFQLDGNSGNRYRVSVAQVGFERYWSAPFELPAGSLSLPGIRLTTSQATALKEVTVTARKPLFEHHADRTVVNVADSPLSAGATALDVLGRSPGVTTDARDNLSLRGRNGLLVVIDGKRVPLTGIELADYLKALPAEQVQSIELITNPGAKYDAQGGAGVIAINLKRDQRLGTNGSANVSYGRGQYGKFTGGLSLNHRGKNVSSYSSYAYSDRQGFALLDFTRRYAATSTQLGATSQLATERLSHLRSHTAKLGADFTLTKHTQLGVALSGLGSQTVYATTNNTEVNTGGSSIERYSSTLAQTLTQPSGAANLNLRHTFADSATARSLSADVDWARYRTTRVLGLNTYFTEPVQPSTVLDGNQRSTLTIQSVKADFGQPLPYRTRLEAGAKMTQVVSDNDVAFVTTSRGVSTFRADISTPFRYEENVNAAYASLRGTLPKTTWQAGLRAEQTNTLAEVSGEKTNEQHYLQLFPSASVQRTLSERHALALSAARRIDRPTYGQVNPLRNYFDATSYRSGNPELVAQTSYNFELSHTYRQKFSTAVAYAQTALPIVNVVQPSPDGGRVVVNRDVNLSAEHFYGLTLTAPLDLAKWWALYANGVAFYDRVVGRLNDTPLDRGRVAFSLTANNSFTLPHGWSADVNGQYQSGQVFAFETIRPRGQVSAGVQKSLWNKQGTLRVNVADIFYTTPVSSTSTYDNFSETFRRGEDTRVVTAALTYRFGNSKVAGARKRAAGADEEIKRATGL